MLLKHLKIKKNAKIRDIIIIQNGVFFFLVTGVWGFRESASILILSNICMAHKVFVIFNGVKKKFKNVLKMEWQRPGASIFLTKTCKETTVGNVCQHLSLSLNFVYPKSLKAKKRQPKKFENPLAKSPFAEFKTSQNKIF
jgi:hypothetical protein